MRSVNVGSINVRSFNVRSFYVPAFHVNSFSVARCSTESSVPRTEYAGRFMAGQVFAAALMKLERTRIVDRQFRHRHTDSVTKPASPCQTQRARAPCTIVWTSIGSAEPPKVGS